MRCMWMRVSTDVLGINVDLWASELNTHTSHIFLHRALTFSLSRECNFISFLFCFFFFSRVDGEHCRIAFFGKLECWTKYSWLCHPLQFHDMIYIPSSNQRYKYSANDVEMVPFAATDGLTNSNSTHFIIISRRNQWIKYVAQHCGVVGRYWLRFNDSISG